jgi:hypothetical protein
MCFCDSLGHATRVCLDNSTWLWGSWTNYTECADSLDELEKRTVSVFVYISNHWFRRFHLFKDVHAFPRIRTMRLKVLFFLQKTCLDLGS